MQKINQEILNLRKKINLTQQEFATLLDVDTSYISRLERGQRDPSLRLLRKIKKLFPIAEFRI